MHRASDRFALVAGASGTIGHAIAGRLAAKGWPLLATYRSREPRDSPPRTTWARFDAADDADVDRLRAVAEGQRGSLGALFVCIGAPSSKRRVSDTDLAEFRSAYVANTLSLVAVWHAVCQLARASQTRVVVVGSEAAASSTPGNGPYAAAKSALHALALTLAKEEAEHGVRVNVLAPSLVASAQAEQILKNKGVSDIEAYYRSQPWGRALAPAEVAEVAVTIATDASWAYASGQIFPLVAARA